MDESYMRGIRAKQRRPSAKVLAKCAVRLNEMAETLSKSPNERARERALHVKMLADQCFAEIIQTAKVSS